MGRYVELMVVPGDTGMGVVWNRTSNVPGVVEIVEKEFTEKESLIRVFVF